MPLRRVNVNALLLALSASGVLSGAAGAQQYPVRPIRMVVGFAAGGATDISARALGQKISETIGQQVVVENRPGASSMLAAEIVARATADGYTLLFANATIAMPSLFAKLPFDPRKDLAPVSLAGYGPLALTAHPSLPAKRVKDLIALAKRRPGELNYASAGAGSFTHLAMALFVIMTDTNIVHVPYKGGAPSVIATMSGESQITFASVGASIPPIRQGKLLALAVSGLKRNVALPDVPTVSEAGVAGYEASSWYGLLAQAATLHSIIARLGENAAKALGDPQLKERLLSQGIEPAAGGVEEFSGYFA
ncbi:MAG: tripartite tricarboxylate transporter substrate binding protein, partial [Burkholderiales bacterium]